MRIRRGRATVTGRAIPGSQKTVSTRALTDGTRHPEEVCWFHMRRLLLVRHASTAAVRAAAFGADEDLDGAGVEAASPAHRSRRTERR